MYQGIPCNDINRNLAQDLNYLISDHFCEEEVNHWVLFSCDAYRPFLSKYTDLEELKSTKVLDYFIMNQNLNFVFCPTHARSSMATKLRRNIMDVKSTKELWTELKVAYRSKLVDVKFDGKIGIILPDREAQTNWNETYAQEFERESFKPTCMIMSPKPNHSNATHIPQYSFRERFPNGLLSTFLRMSTRLKLTPGEISSNSLFWKFLDKKDFWAKQQRDLETLKKI